MTSNEKVASPIDAIFPDWDWVSGYGANLPGSSRSGIGVAEEAKVDTRRKAARPSTVRNRIEFPPHSNSDFDREKERAARRQPKKAGIRSFAKQLRINLLNWLGGRLGENLESTRPVKILPTSCCSHKTSVFARVSRLTPVFLQDNSEFRLRF